MMTLPKFTNPDPDIGELRKEQGRLKSQADKLLRETAIFELFSKYGELSAIGGSYQYDLMVYPDLDVGLLSPDVDKRLFAELVSDIVASQYVRKIATADCVNFAPVHKGRPKGYWIGLEIPFENDRWGLDCWLQQPAWTTDGTDTYAERLGTLEQTGRDAILLIKYDLIRRGLYGRTVFSDNVYDAVLDGNVRSITEFDQYRKNASM